ncbi:hypothetical protein KIH39_13030 [Telmatocola sphagniphila]|uniref:ThuA-like domain-containing protein n=1 Tax=Telmatocola sphagniphila TaxID=1123043 RepID=A0A8E6EVC8_9BACT|nr:hypothetical protein [Telmatocola sphagniphila]QVL34789.1 hypothetical protein KIH39_13030 [Telmatocola sphagniphila]
MRMIFQLLLLTGLFGGVVQADDRVVYPAKDGPGKGKHLVFLAGDEEYRSEEGLPMLAKILSQRHGFKCTVVFAVDDKGFIDPNKSASISAPDALDTADGIIMGLRFRRYPDSAMKHFEDAYLRGIPIIGLRTSTHAFAGLKGTYASYNNFGRNVLGENWVNHWGDNHRYATKGIIEESAKGEKILNGVEHVFGDSGTYETHPQPDSKILLRGQVVNGLKPSDPPATHKRKATTGEQPVNEPMMAIAWTRIPQNPAGKENKVFCTTMGAATDLENEDLRRLVVNAVYWGHNLEIPAKADVNYVDPYKPKTYAFNGFRRGIKPEDHALGKELKEGQGTDPKQK